VLFTNGFTPAAGAMSAVVSVGVTLYVTAIVPPAGTVNVPDVPTLEPPLIEIAVTVPPLTVADTGTGFGFGAATVVAARVIADVNKAGAAVTTALPDAHSDPASTNTLVPDTCTTPGAIAYLFAIYDTTGPAGYAARYPDSTPVTLPTPAAGAVVVKFADHKAISDASVTESRFAPASTNIGTPDSSAQNGWVA